jgi:hypothetical protein
LGMLQPEGEPDGARVAARALGELPASAARAEGLRLAMMRRHEPGTHGYRMSASILSAWGESPEALQVALDELQHPDASLQDVAVAARHHPELRRKLRDLMCPLTVSLRRRYYQLRFESGLGLTQPDQRFEADPMAAAAAASAWVLAAEPSQREEIVATCVQDLRAPYGPQNPRSQAGLCGLLELDALEHFAEQHIGDRLLQIDVIGFPSPNWWITSRLAAKFETALAAVPDLPGRLRMLGDDPHSFWAAMAPFAASRDSSLRRALLEYIRDAGIRGEPELLRFLAAVRPRSDELLQHLLDSVHTDVIDRSPSRDLLLTGCDVLAENFAGNESALDQLLERFGPPVSEGNLLALASIWPDHPKTLETFARAKGRVRLSHDVGARIALLFSPPAQAIDAFDQWLRYGETQGRLIAPPTIATLRRLARDPGFTAELRRAVLGSDQPSLLASGARLLAASGNLDPDATTSLWDRCRTALDGSQAYVLALDVLAGRVRPLGWSLRGALSRS